MFRVATVAGGLPETALESFGFGGGRPCVRDERLQTDSKAPAWQPFWMLLTDLPCCLQKLIFSSLLLFVA